MRAGIASATVAWRIVRLAACLAAPVATVGSAEAQVGESLLLPAVVPPGFNRGHNQGVTELPRPNMDPVGIRLGSFNLLPSLRSGVGATSNTYYTADPIGSAFLTNTPTAQLISQWNRHELLVSGTGTFREYLNQSRRNETTWQTDVRGRVDLGRFTNVTLEEISSQLTENQFSGETTPTVAALSRYRRDFFSSRAVNQVGRMRLTLGADYSMFRFQDLPLLDGGSRSQTNRNRNVARVTGQAEYAWSPDLAIFIQAAYADQAFQTQLSPGVPNVDSRGYRIISGVNFDDPGFARGSLGVGYTRQDFIAAIYRSVAGFSIQGRVDLFPTRLMTVRIDASRTIEITNLSLGGAAYWNNRVAVRVDREVWRRIIVNASAAYNRQNFIVSEASVKSFQLGLGAQYVSTRRVVVDADIDYGKRNNNNADLGSSFTEIRADIGLTYRI